MDLSVLCWGHLIVMFFDQHTFICESFSPMLMNWYSIRILYRMLSREGMETLTTALYFKGDPFLHSWVSSQALWVRVLIISLSPSSDAVFGVKSSLVVDPTLVEDDEKARKLGFKKGPYWHLKKDFVLLKTSQAEEQKRKSLANYYASLQWLKIVIFGALNTIGEAQLNRRLS